jgi:hypothetical protein
MAFSPWAGRVCELIVRQWRSRGKVAWPAEVLEAAQIELDRRVIAREELVEAFAAWWRQSRRSAPRAEAGGGSVTGWLVTDGMLRA